MKKLQPADLNAVRTVPLDRRKSLVDMKDFAKTPCAGGSVQDLVDGLPGIYAGRQFRCLVGRIADAARGKRMVLMALGGHVIKCGLSPVVIELMKRGVVRAVAMNGAAAIHDFEIALCGRTSEDVSSTLATGEFGFAEETGCQMNSIISSAAEKDMGLGEALGLHILGNGFANAGTSILATAAELQLPMTVHVALGTDIIHQHPAADGAATGKTSMRDFRLLVTVVGELDGGGVVMNVGSAVVLPEVFLKALSVARNLGGKVDGFTAANLDFLQQYRALENVVRRPTAGGGRGIALTGHHEIMLPLLAAAVLDELEGNQGRAQAASEK